MDPDPLPNLFLLALEPSISVSSIALISFILVALLFLSAVLAGSEVAFFSLNADQRISLRESELGSEKKVSQLLDKPQQLLATLLIAINFINIIFITLANYLTSMVLGQQSMETLLVTLFLLFGVTFIITFFGELIPKVWAQQNNLNFARYSAPLISFLNFVFAPLSKALLGISGLIEKRVKKKSYTLTSQELNQALEITTDENTSDREKDILRGILNFGNISVKSVMQARRDIVAFDTSMNFHELMDLINKNGYSRVPVYNETIDKIEGILYIKDLLKHIDQDEKFDWLPLLHSPFFVPENKKIDDLLYDFQEKRVHMAVIVNEYGETEGLVTMEDIIEEIVGEINDEFDEVEADYKKIGDNIYVFEAKTSLNDFCRVFEIEASYFEKAKGESETLAGLIIELFGRIPSAGEEIEFEDFTFKVQSVDTRRIKKVRVTQRVSADQDDSQN
ncbi:gliding motility-associated protein GldE [Aquirufa antheringensis]|uniref:Gliding motility-associated protein GldE n=1 Tax=Aquirufa antheringensis TaxID=2516559 RepID=A0A4Q9BIF1_9BACT|nr:gliding motility-associated protein GldE [Aquirufa antheringensis]MCZ2484785.1 gliding motility-associated protein GldE [Aquirufa antheringensis]MCZ2486987.1 gliding motility-associated protein GldE [Aquirufa antheringensis]TBH75098.1 gliding motility-associated protein GldE [Aquirufa antheringensis]USQ03387.1 gliding motility-associated protein GldE [Aquirufa antheringensis]